MPTRLDLPVEEIARLRDVEEKTWREIKEKLDLDCHTTTVRRHYQRYKQQLEKELEMQAMLDDLAAKEEIQEAKEPEKEPTLWERIKNWFRKVF